MVLKLIPEETTVLKKALQIAANYTRGIEYKQNIELLTKIELESEFQNHKSHDKS